MFYDVWCLATDSNTSRGDIATTYYFAVLQLQEAFSNVWRITGILAWKTSKHNSEVTTARFSQDAQLLMDLCNDTHGGLCSLVIAVQQPS